MNYKSGNDYLLVHENANVATDLFRLAIKYAEHSQTVLYLCPKSMVKLPVIEIQDREVLKKIIFMYLDEIQQLTGKFLELHSWSIVPALVIVDSFHELKCKSASEPPDVDKYILCVASLFNCMHFLRRKSDKECTSVVVVDSKATAINWQILVDLFYYKTVLKDLEVVTSSLKF